MASNHFIGNTPIKDPFKKIKGFFVEIEDEVFYKIENYSSMRPFFMTIVSSSDHWMFLSSNGGITAGRKNSDSALFPYYTDDKIIDSAEITGSKTIMHVHKGQSIFVYEPFSDRNTGVYDVSRNIYKNRFGNKVLFEETNHDLKIRFTYLMTFSDQLGFVKNSRLVNLSSDDVYIELLDGLQNILPYGINEDLQVKKSTLADAYKKAELDEGSGLGLFSLSAMIVDKAEPSEALQATTVWSTGLEVEKYLLSSTQLNKFRMGRSIENETDIRAERGAYFLNTAIELKGEKEHSWYFVADVNQSIASITKTQRLIKEPGKAISLINKEINENTHHLIEKIGLADGLQLTNDQLSSGRHLSNVLFNIMRGGVFQGQYSLEKEDFINYVYSINPKVADKNSSFLNSLSSNIDYLYFVDQIRIQKDVDLERIFYEYLPLSFSRRHGDPSRPWNKFTIDTQTEGGSLVKNYEGNWRDIFQNWEALAISFPKFLEGMITKFVNASTIDGYNPYRITRDGIDWEVIEPDDPWSFIGYWGDHQLIYLLKLLELSDKFNPGELEELFVRPINVYANVPYRIKSYENLLANPSDTVEFDNAIEAEVKSKLSEFGADGKLVFTDSQKLVRANLTEKILVSILTKLYNFIPGAGIWLNTQRPEWNDANNALVGNGTSMVTLYYLRRFLMFYSEKIKHINGSKVILNESVFQLLIGVITVLDDNKGLLSKQTSSTHVRLIMDALGQIGEEYRTTAYLGFDGKTEEVEYQKITQLCTLALEYIDHTIASNQRDDGLYHAYNLVSFENDSVGLEYLYEMLEGQVSVMSSGFLSPAKALDLLNNLKASKLYREDQYSYLLYPDRTLPLFVERNNIPDSFIETSQLAKLLIQFNDRSIIEQDINKKFHFNAHFHNSSELEVALDYLKMDDRYTKVVSSEYNDYLEIFEKVFNHKAFTGRSGTFYGYEGLGSIYWHMVSKLLMATQECILEANLTKQPEEIIGQLISHYYEIRAGIGINKSPELYGAFPTDAYSHTPGNAGVQQPGMTGQVKEDIINRWAELGIIVKNGIVSFNPSFLHANELLKEDSVFSYYNLQQDLIELPIESGSLAFTYCQVPIIYKLSKEPAVKIEFADSEVINKSLSLSADHSSSLLSRSGEIKSITCHLTETSFI